MPAMKRMILARDRIADASLSREVQMVDGVSS